MKIIFPEQVAPAKIKFNQRDRLNAHTGTKSYSEIKIVPFERV